jgi:hypothetical protein
MSIKIYAKKGKRNYKEMRMIQEIQPIIDKRLQGNPEAAESFVPASNYDELEAMHRMYAVQDTEFVEIKNKDMAKSKSEGINVDDKEVTTTIEKDDIFEDDGSFIDPFNRQEPTTYDYTLEGGLSKDDMTQKGPARSDFAEPLSFDEAFQLPDDDSEEPVEKTQQGKNEDSQKQQPNQKRERKEPLNPSFDEMSGSKQKKSTKKFAKYIVEAVCALAEKGFVWYANKDINDAKLAEYELSGEMNLSILVTLENGQDATVKQFFQQQCLAAEQLGKFEEEEKRDMSEALAEVFMEKGIAPTATQELMIIVGGVLVKKGAILLSLKSQTNSLLSQLRMMNDGQPQQQQYEQPQPQPQYEQPEQPVNQVYSEVNGVPNATIEELQNELVADDDMLEIEQVVVTKE